MHNPFPSGSPTVSTTPDFSKLIAPGSDSDLPLSDAITKLVTMEQFNLAFAIYCGWSVIAWLSHMAGMVSISMQTAVTNLIGICATNVLFFTIARSQAPHRPSEEITALAQSVVGIAWATLFTFMSSGSHELSIGIYASVLLFAMLRVRRNVLNRLTVFAVSSYLTIFIIKMLTREPPSITPASLVQILIFISIMLCLVGTGRYVYRHYNRIKGEYSQLQQRFRSEYAGSGVNSVNRRYILDLLARHKGRTDRSNITFCICIFNADYVDMTTLKPQQDVKRLALRNVEAVIRAELRDMDSLNGTSSHDCFEAYSEKTFIAILPDTNLTGAQCAAERIITTATMQDDIIDNHTRLCGGVAEYRRGEIISVLLERAEEALNTARALNTSCVCISGHSPPKKYNAAVVRLKTSRR